VEGVGEEVRLVLYWPWGAFIKSTLEGS
jgi:hypothetical protein